MAMHPKGKKEMMNDKDKKATKTNGLTAAQKKLPKALQEAILKKKAKKK